MSCMRIKVVTRDFASSFYKGEAFLFLGGKEHGNL